MTLPHGGFAYTTEQLALLLGVGIGVMRRVWLGRHSFTNARDSGVEEGE